MKNAYHQGHSHHRPQIPADGSTGGPVPGHKRLTKDKALIRDKE
jgi:hypothetical protein